MNGSPTGAPVAASHTRTVLSLLPETTMVRPSSCPTATAFTQSSWPVNGSPTGAPVAASHTRTVSSSLPETTTVRPSSSPDRHRAHPVVVAGERVADRVAGGRVPHPHRPVAAAGDHHGAPVQLARPPPRLPRRVWPVNGSPSGVPVAASHTRTVSSSLPETTTVRAVQLARPPPLLPSRVAGERRP